MYTREITNLFISTFVLSLKKRKGSGKRGEEEEGREGGWKERRKFKTLNVIFRRMDEQMTLYSYIRYQTKIKRDKLALYV